MFCMRMGGEGLEKRGFPQLGRGYLGREYVGLAMPWSWYREGLRGLAADRLGSPLAISVHRISVRLFWLLLLFGALANDRPAILFSLLLSCSTMCHLHVA